MKASIAIIGAVLGLSRLAHGQAAPAGSGSGPAFNPGPTLPAIDGTFSYALSASEAIQGGYYGGSGVTYLTNLSGNVEYISPSQVHPFSMLYGGGVQFSSYSVANTQVYQNFIISQGWVEHGWAFGVSDAVSYLPQSPTTGLSGVPGVGDLGLQPAPDPNVPAQLVLTNYGKRLSNTLNGSIERQLNGRTSISGSANYGILRFIGDTGSNSSTENGLDSTNISGNVGLNRRLDPRSSGSVSGYYSTFSYTGNLTSFSTKGINLTYSRQLTKTLGASVSVGPQFVSGFEAYPVEKTVISVAVPSSVNVAVSTSLTYSHGLLSAVASYSRGTNEGSGLQTGAFSDTVTAGVQRSVRRDWSTSLTGTYTRNTALAVPGATQSVYGGAQVSRRLGSSTSLFVSYTAIHQSTAASLAGSNAFNGFSQVGSIGVSFSPRGARLGQF
jgi:hypothetical protein